MRVASCEHLISNASKAHKILEIVKCNRLLCARVHASIQEYIDQTAMACVRMLFSLLPSYPILYRFTVYNLASNIPISRLYLDWNGIAG